jgi:hypothetical protein
MSLRYLNEKLSDAIYILTTGPGDVRSRLYSALPKLLILSGFCLPSELECDLKWIQQKLTERNKHEYGYDDGRSLRLMRNSTGTKIAERIVRLQWRINDLIEEERNKD